jgi:hypothetical protein
MDATLAQVDPTRALSIGKVTAQLPICNASRGRTGQ